MQQKKKFSKLSEERVPSNGMLPLDYMLSVMRDPKAAQGRRDRMALAAAPYCHRKLTEAQFTKGKKDQRTEAAETAGVGTPWANDLETEIQVN